MNNIEIINIIVGLATVVGVFFAALGVFFAGWEIKQNHKWNRREYAVRLLENWNVQTYDHRKEIERALPRLIDNPTGKLLMISRKDSEKIYDSKPGEKEWELRFHIVGLLNFFELICSAYSNETAEQGMVEKSFKKTLIRLYGSLYNFMIIVYEKRDYMPWEPFVEQIKNWTQLPPESQKDKYYIPKGEKMARYLSLEPEEFVQH